MQKVIKKGGGQFVNRGDPAAIDFNTVAFTLDDAYHDLDLSGIVPAGAKAVLLRVEIDDPVNANLFFKARRKGNVNIRNISQIKNPVAGIHAVADLIVAVDASRGISYCISTGINTAQVTVGGWWL